MPRKDLLKAAQESRGRDLRVKDKKKQRPRTFKWDRDASTKYQQSGAISMGNKLDTWKCREGVYCTYSKLNQMFKEKYPSPLCPVCKKEEETIFHVTSVCTAYANFRTKRHNNGLGKI